MITSVKKHPVWSGTLEVVGNPSDLVEHVEFLDKSDAYMVYLGGLMVTDTSTEGKHDGRPAVRFTLHDMRTSQDCGRVVVFPEVEVSWMLDFSSTEEADEWVERYEASKTRSKVSRAVVDYDDWADGETLTESIAKMSARFGVGVRVVSKKGPGGAIPVVELSGLTENVEKALTDTKDGWGFHPDEVDELLLPVA